jgi:asparagine synthase (glutamine-hydrolysing)
MCGIIGSFNNADASKLVKKGIALMKSRGRDGYSICTDSDCSKSKSLAQVKAGKSRNAIGHCLHSVVGNVLQPLKSNAIIAANCEIYNWKELKAQYGIAAGNDAELMLRLFEKAGKVCDAAELLDGDYAFAFWHDGRVILGRDIVGVKPLFYSHSHGFAFASEKKVLEKLGYHNVIELSPRKFLTYEVDLDRLYFTERSFFTLKPQVDGLSLEKLFTDAVRKRIPEKKLGLLFSGGLDSTIIALTLKRLGCDFTCYTTVLREKGMKDAEDLEFAKLAAKDLGLKLRVRYLTLKEVPKLLKKIVPIIEDTNVTKVGVALAFYPACELAKKDGIKVMISGLGSEEIFAGYQRHKESSDINKECRSGLLKMYERDLYRDDAITMANSLELRVPFLDRSLVDYALKLPAGMKIDGDRDKIALRELALKLGLNKQFADRKKRAAQYGSRTLSAIQKLTNRQGLGLKADYLRQFYKAHNLRLAALVSGGKDSLYAMHIMHKQNYKIGCLVTIKSKNPDSYMFHTPAIDIVDYQAESLGIPLIKAETSGRKEEELSDLRKALDFAKKRHKIDGVITGALYSTYQRDRVEKICDELGLKIFSPLWHMNQETEMKEILENGFHFILTKIAADGLDRSWLGKQITHSDIVRLARLNKKIGLNVAGEGGEFESLVIDMPMFTRKLKVTGRPVMENTCTGVFEIEKVVLEAKLI